jgi:membrane-associated protease RseP (regulator of RpoE activity)
MTTKPYSRYIRPLALGFALSLLASAPSSADPWHGQPGGHCQNANAMPMTGMGDCPMAKQGLARAPMSGKSLGVLISGIPDARLDETGLGYGVQVEKVMPESAAAAAGIKAGDVITEFAGKPVYSGERLRWLVQKAEAGKAVEVKLSREGKAMSVNATLADPVAPPCKEKASGRVGT